VGRLDVLDGLRGIAVLLVLWFHVWEISWIPGLGAPYLFIAATGYVGVHMFFFLSGFVIAYPFIRAAASGTPPPTWGHFAWRRLLKIVPSYALSIVVAFAIGYAATQSSGEPVWSDVVKHLLFVHTWWLPTYGSINGVLWTLAVEVEFYVVFPLVWWCFRRQPWVTAAALVGIAFAWRHYFYSCCFSSSFLYMEQNLPGFLDIFAIGMISAHVYVHYGTAIARTVQRRYAATIVGIGGLGLLALLQHDIYAHRDINQWAGVWDLDHRPLLGLAFALAALGSIAAIPLWRKLLANPVFLYLAGISYNLYLYHQLVARELLLHHWPPFSTADQHDDPHWGPLFNVMAFAASIAAATVITYFFERPILRWGGQLFRR
jgi:peptidoglycan/LPS O-acetylase OafA/YrhL